MGDSRILFVSHSSVISGAEVILLELVKPFAKASAFVFERGPLQDRLASMGLSVRPSRWAGGVSRVKRDGSLLRAVPLAGRLMAVSIEIAQEARRHDVIYANSQKAFMLSAPVAKILRKPLIWHLHDIPSREHFGKAQLALQIRLANSCAARVIVPSLAVSDAFVKAGGKPELVCIVPNGIPVPGFHRQSKESLRHDLGIPSAPTVGVFSRLAAWKGQHILIEALADLPAVHAVIAGTALFGEEAYAAELQSLVARLGLEDRVHFLGHRSDVRDLMRAVDVVIHPSISPEPFGLTLVEAAFAETPIVAADAGAVPEILDSGKAGWLVTQGSASALSLAIENVLLAPSEVAMRVSYARERAEALYTVDHMLSRVSAVIAELQAGH